MKGKKGVISSVIGLFVIVLGLLLLLHSLGILTLSLASLFRTYWPVLLILAGIALMMRKSVIGTVLLGTLVVLSVYLFVVPLLGPGQQPESHVESVLLSADEGLSLSMDFGGGTLLVQEGASSSAFIAKAEAVQKPEIKVERKDDDVLIDIERGSGFLLGERFQERWELDVPPGHLTRMEVDYGAAEVLIDLRGLEVETLDIDAGAASTELVFSSYPTKTEISTGASSLQLLFPVGYPVRLGIEGGAVSQELNGFESNDDHFISAGYLAGTEAIEVSIRAGAASVEAGFYEEASG